MANSIPLPSAAELLVLQCQHILGSFLEPDSGLSPEECISELLAALDSREAVRIAILYSDIGQGHTIERTLAEGAAEQPQRQTG